MRTGAFEDVLDDVMGVPGVRGALVVNLPDGLVVDGRVHVDVRGEAVAALAASLYRRVRSAVGVDGSGTEAFVELDAEDGRIMILGQADLALMAVIDRRANVGQIRVALRRAVDGLHAGRSR